MWKTSKQHYRDNRLSQLILDLHGKVSKYDFSENYVNSENCFRIHTNSSHSRAFVINIFAADIPDGLSWDCIYPGIQLRQRDTSTIAKHLATDILADWSRTCNKEYHTQVLTGGTALRGQLSFWFHLQLSKFQYNNAKNGGGSRGEFWEL